MSKHLASGRLMFKQQTTLAWLWLGAIAAMVGSADSAQAATVTVDGAAAHQTIEGLGGSMESHEGYANESAFWDLLFDEIGVSAINIGGPGTADYTTNPNFQEETVPMVQQAVDHGVETYVLISTPKPAWKHTGVLAGGTLLAEYYDDYAYYMLDYIDYIKTHSGVEADYILPFPEPNWLGVSDPDGPWPYCFMEENDYRNFMKVAGPIFDSAGTATKLSVPCGNQVPVTVSYANTIMADPDVRTHVDGFATNPYEWPHATNPSSWQELANLANQYGKTGTWVAEVSHYTLGDQMPAAHAAGIYTAKWLHEALVYGNVSHYYWITMLDFGRNRESIRGLIHSKEFPPGEFATNGITKVGYAFRQFARWVRPGAIRVEASSDDAYVLVSAFKNPMEGTFTLVAINDDPQSERSVTFKLSGLDTVSSLEVHRTSATEDGVALDDVDVTSGSFSHTLPAESTTTFALTVPEPAMTLQYASALAALALLGRIRASRLRRRHLRGRVDLTWVSSSESR